jgi:co-chaperonin GroES (HSP10)
MVYVRRTAGKEMIELLDDKIAVIPLEDPDKIGSIWIPDQAKQRADQGIVKYKGPNVSEIFVGAHVFYGGYVGTKVSVEGEGVLVIMSESDVQLIFVEESERLIPASEIIDLVDRVHGQMLTSIGGGTQPEQALAFDTCALFRQRLYSEVKDHFLSRGIEF